MANIKRLLFHTYIHACRALFGVDKKKAVMTSFSGKSYSDNPRAISEALHLVAPDIKQVWLFANPEQKKGIVPDYLTCVNSANSFRRFWELATAGAYIDNFTLPEIPKGKGQLFIQTWHGDKAFKRVLCDASATGKRHVAEEQDGYCNYAVAGSRYGESQYRTAFRYQGNVLMCGTPRNDKLLRMLPREVAEVKVRVGIKEETRLLLYAPTFRDHAAGSKTKQQVRDLDITKTLDVLEKRDGCKWKCLLRAHPGVAGLDLINADERIVDVSQYEDMADLLLIGDMLITDYSSCAGDFALTGRPVVLFQSDKQEYLEKDRSFYFDIEDSPYYVANTQEELEEIISNMTEEKARKNGEEILKFYGDCETGNASEYVAKIIKDWAEGKG